MPQLSEKTKWSRVARFFLFCAIVGLVGGAAYAIPGFNELVTTIQHNALYLALVCLGMIAIAMALVAGVGSWGANALVSSWKKQLLEVCSFFWAIATAKAIAGLLNMLVPIETDNDGVAVLFYFIYFTIGCLILAPFQWLAFRYYKKRKGIVNGA
jgi:hypothetical protein